MVKADARKDYYADLELQPGATAEEIKKQFKKLALKYHPDRNPGHELEFNSKFQAIQSAHEVLTDSSQRAKYDADRIRSGLFYNYASPTRPNVPPRSPATNFAPPPPPPPRPPPPTAAKTNYAPPPTSANRYAQYVNAEAAKSRPYTEGDDSQTKANAFKAWEQMRHGQGPPPGRKVPPRPTRTTFQHRPTSNGTHEEPPIRRTAPGWEEFQESQSMPRMTRANTTRVPKKPTYAPGTTGGDMLSAQYRSAYSHARPDRSHRMNPQYAPPPQAGQKKADPLRSFKSSHEGDDMLNNSDRISTPYATAGGEKTYFSSHSFGRSGTSQERRKSAEWYENDASAKDGPQSRAPPATPDRPHHSASPKMRTPKHVPQSSSSSSASSSDESISLAQRPLGTRRKPLRNPAAVPQKPILKPSVKVSEAENRESKQTGPAGLRNSWTDGPRKPQTADTLTSDQPEGFLQHRMKRESLRSDPNRRPSLVEESKTTQEKPQHPLNRPRSWNEQYGTPRKPPETEPRTGPGTGGQPNQGPMYEFSGYSQSPCTPSSHKWAEQWPFMSPKKPRTSSERPPYWAVPSSLPPSSSSPSKQSGSATSEEAIIHSLLVQNFANDPFVDDADSASNSFTFAQDDVKKPFARAPPFRSHSSESINTNFSPPKWTASFTSGTDLVPPQPPPSNAPISPTSSARAMPPPPPPRQEHVPSSSAPTSGIPFPVNGEATTTATAPASSSDPLTTSKEDWARHFKPASWDYPASASSSPVRGVSRKRAKTPRKYSKIPSRRPQNASVSEAADEHAEDQGAASVESLSNQTSENESAMDIDPVLTPPSGQSSTEHRSSAQSDRTVTGAGGRSGPPGPPRSDEASSEPPGLNLSDIQNVAPFAPNAEGLRDLKELNTALPFDSQSSNEVPGDLAPKPLELPSPPKAPLIPPTLTQTSWERYLAQMRSYMFEWNTYNSKMLAHFTERQSNVGTLNGDWMSTVGHRGYKQYMQGVEDDFRVRQHWDVSWEKHHECMKGLGTVRQRMLGVKNGLRTTDLEG